MFHEDAVTAAPILGIALTSRNKKSKDETPLCGVPYHSISGPINKLLAKGLKLAVVEQMEDPKSVKGLVKRAVTRILTPGMVYDATQLDSSSGHYLASFQDQCLAFLDTTTGEAFCYPGLSENDLPKVLALWPVAEVVLRAEVADHLRSLESLQDFLSVLPLTILSAEALSTFSRLNLGNEKSVPQAGLNLLAYVQSSRPEDSKELLREAFSMLQEFEIRSLEKTLRLSEATLKHLEIFESSSGSDDSLFKVLDKTRTSGGARLLRKRLTTPSTDLKVITDRHDSVADWFSRPEKLKSIRQSLGQVGDLERRLGRLAQPNCNARDLRSFAESCISSLEALELAEGFDQKFQDCAALATRVLRSVVAEPPLLIRQGGMIAKGVDARLDELIALTDDSHSVLAEFEERERQTYSIPTLKVKYNGVFGYSIEVTNTHAAKAPAHYIRRQTLANAERFTTPELVELEKKILSAESRRSDLEYEMFTALKAQLLTQSHLFLKLAAATSELDWCTAAAWLALEDNHVRPLLLAAEERGLRLHNSRHPVVEASLKSREGLAFVSNTIELRAGQVLLLTGPNMAGKSTLMRQVALSVIMAQSGLFVPATQAQMQVFDKIFTRIGASDQLARGQSTFMVEMQETAEMVNFASSRSLLILDEVGRGTSTYDGLSLAQSILEYIVNRIGAMTVFATHYHELAELSNVFAEVRNAHMSVIEKDGEVRFLHTLREGPAQKSYGIYVAKIAGLPESILIRAQILLKKLESGSITKPHRTSSSAGSFIPQLSFLDEKSKNL